MNHCDVTKWTLQDLHIFTAYLRTFTTSIRQQISIYQSIGDANTLNARCILVSGVHHTPCLPFGKLVCLKVATLSSLCVGLQAGFGAGAASGYDAASYGANSGYDASQSGYGQQASGYNQPAYSAAQVGRPSASECLRNMCLACAVMVRELMHNLLVDMITFSEAVHMKSVAFHSKHILETSFRDVSLRFSCGCAASQARRISSDQQRWNALCMSPGLP